MLRSIASRPDTFQMPTISFVIITYNQENLVRDAVLSALGQEGDPIEVVISDDASKDRTVSVIREIVENYRGPHRVILNCNPTNLGIALNFQKAVSLCSGDWIVSGGGDDVSHQGRAVLIRKIATQNPDATAISSHYLVEHEDGAIALGDVNWHMRMMRMQRWSPEKILTSVCLGRPMLTVLGAATAWRKDLFEKFPPLSASARGASEDGILRWRAFILGKVIFLKEPLVTYRRAPSSTTHISAGLGASLRARAKRKLLFRALCTLKQSRRDFVWAREQGLFNANRAKSCISRLDYLIGYSRAQIMFGSVSLPRKICLLIYYLPAGMWRQLAISKA